MRWLSIKKLNIKRKRFLNNRNKRIQIKKAKFNRKERRNKKRIFNYNKNKANKFKSEEIIKKAPVDFRLLENTDEV